MTGTRMSEGLLPVLAVTLCNVSCGEGKPLGMSQAELAERIGVSYPRVNEIINGKRGVTPDTALRLSNEVVRNDTRVLAQWPEELGPVACAPLGHGRGPEADQGAG